MTDYEKLKSIVDEADSLSKKEVRWKNPEVQAWYNKTERWLIKYFGDPSQEINSFRKINYQSMLIDIRQDILACQSGLKQAKAILATYFEDLEDKIEIKEVDTPFDLSKVFIVHGHDGELKESVARIIEKQGIEAIILSEQINQGRTVIEQFEDYSDVGGAICLFTADDFGRAKDSENDSCRARQNVVFEAGYFMGKLGRNHVVILADKGVEIPSDLAGVVYTDTNNWQVDMLKELKAIGYNMDLNKLFE